MKSRRTVRRLAMPDQFASTMSIILVYVLYFITAGLFGAYSDACVFAILRAGAKYKLQNECDEI